ncbi:hypothetical protein AKJ09_05585 [Labilithrix luteola]|uniref:AI-2E family transporter n=1 Tax=Labilithrix luteola TaxID=1391654 RepID=A0A0K1PZW2_9BACT|nr:hypothetical protein AKJ09_05585 [Labilithrix luteola]
MTPTQKRALVWVVLLSFALAAWVASPLWVSILLGVILAVSTHRTYDRLRRRVEKKRAPLIAALLTLGSGILVAALSAGIVFLAANELATLVAHFSSAGAGSLAGIVGERAEHVIRELGIDTQRLYEWGRSQLAAAAQYAAATAAVILRKTSFAVLGLVVTLVTMYYMLIEGQDLTRRIELISPLEPRHTRALLDEAREVGRTAFIGTLGTAAVQGVIAGVGYAILGVPHPVTWAVATALASFLPVIGTVLVWGPLAGYLLLEGHPVRAVLLVIYGIIAITSLADYVIRPRLVGKGHGHPLLTLIALLGGIEVFGLAGLVVAPIVMSVFLAAVRLYEREVRAGALPESN